MKWEVFKSNHPVGSRATGSVELRVDHGFFVKFENGIQGHVSIVKFRDDVPVESLEDFPQVGSIVESVILLYHDDRQQVALSTRASDFTRFDN